VDPDTLARSLGAADWVVVDCRFLLAEPAAGERAYLAAHIPGAVYAHLERDLSAPVVPGRSGRHPLPAPADLAATFGRLGIGPGSQVVAYDDAGGALAASRLWWLLRWLGHSSVAVLDGGWQAWLAGGRPTRDGVETRPATRFRPRERPELVAETTLVAGLAGAADARLLDARGADRFRGENETIDPVAGRIPGAVSAPFAHNLGPDGRFLAAAALRERYEALCGGAPADRVAVYCGSGVTAAHDILAMVHAGLGEARLYPGSWSEWITDPARPIASGPAERPPA
jgi:thiosulfate/3-mercaptopyruvate sulfurtransferase